MRGGAVAARRAHNPEVLGSNPSPATKIINPPGTQADFFSLYEGPCRKELESKPRYLRVIYSPKQRESFPSVVE
jgi:hypothetical protein